MYNKTLLPSLKEKSWGYTKMSAFVFLIIIILLMVFQLIELMRIYHITTNERTSDYRGFFWIIYLIFFSIFIDKVEFVDYSLIPAYVEVYMIVLLVFLGLHPIFIFIQYFSPQMFILKKRISLQFYLYKFII